MAPPFEIDSVENTGPTDNSGDDSLWVVWIREPGRELERFLFTLAARFGVPADDAMPLDDEPLTDEDYEATREAREDFEAGWTVSLEELRRELG